MRHIYLDNAATTPMHPLVAGAMQPYLAGFCGNPSSLHAWGRKSKQAVEHSRHQVAHLLGTLDKQIVFTSGGTEANHAALVGAFFAANSDVYSTAIDERGDGWTRPSSLQQGHIVVSAIEHHAVLHTCRWLRQFGAEVSVVLPDAEGRVQVESVLSVIRPDTCLVALMAVNNELGTVQPVSMLAEAVKQSHPRVHVHSDMVQALGAISIPLSALSIDSAAFSAHKIHGPQGVGALYVSPNARWNAVMHGGNQERSRRAGTENVAGIVGFGAAAQRLHADYEPRLHRIVTLREQLWRAIESIPGVRRNTPTHETAPGILNVAFDGIRSDRMLMRLDLDGVAASSGSACTAGTLEPSHVLLACGQAEDQVAEAIRFSLSDMNTVDEIEAAADIVRRLAVELRGV